MSLHFSHFGSQSLAHTLEFCFLELTFGNQSSLSIGINALGAQSIATDLIGCKPTLQVVETTVGMDPCGGKIATCYGKFFAAFNGSNACIHRIEFSLILYEKAIGIEQIEYRRNKKRIAITMVDVARETSQPSQRAIGTPHHQHTEHLPLTAEFRMAAEIRLQFGGSHLAQFVGNIIERIVEHLGNRY